MSKLNKSYVFQLYLKDARDEDMRDYVNGKCYTYEYVVDDIIKDIYDIINALYAWTYTITTDSSDEFDEFEMTIDGMRVNRFEEVNSL